MQLVIYCHWMKKKMKIKENSCINQTFFFNIYIFQFFHFFYKYTFNIFVNLSILSPVSLLFFYKTLFQLKRENFSFFVCNFLFISRFFISWFVWSFNWNVLLIYCRYKGLRKFLHKFCPFRLKKERKMNWYIFFLGFSKIWEFSFFFPFS